VLASHAKKVYWVFPGEKPYEDEEAVQALLARGNVELVPRAQPVSIKGERRVEALVVRGQGPRAESGCCRWTASSWRSATRRKPGS